MKRALSTTVAYPPLKHAYPPFEHAYPPICMGHPAADGSVAYETIEDVCYPFVSENGKPMGDTKQEALNVAWAISEVPKKNSETRDIINFMRLKRSADSTDQVYTELANNGDEDVSLGDIESRLEFKIGLPSSPHPAVGDDPYWARRIEHAVSTSMCAFVNSIDHVCTSMSGMARGQTTPLVEENVVAAKTALVNQMTRLLTSTSATKLDVRVAIDDIIKEYVPKCVEIHKERIKRSIRGVISLSRVYAASNSQGTNLEREIHTHYSALQEVCSQPPLELEQQMAERGLSMSVLCSCFVEILGTVVGCTMLRPSLGGIAHTLQEYFTTVGDDFGCACASTISVLKRYASTPDTSEMWHAIDLEEIGCARSISAASNVSLNDIHHMPCPSHTSAGKGFVLIKNDHNCGSGLRTCRMLHAVSMAAAKANVLVPRTFKSSIVLASIARFRSDAFFHIGGALTDVKSSSGAKRGARSSLQEDVIVYTQKEFVPKTIAPCMERDFEILVAFLKALPTTEGVISLKQINESVRAMGGSFSKQRDSSLVQVVSHISRKVIQKIHEEVYGEYTLDYIASAPGVSGGGFVHMDGPGNRILCSWISTLINSVERGDKAAVKKWHASRSSRSRAKTAGLGPQKPRYAKGQDGRCLKWVK